MKTGHGIIPDGKMTASVRGSHNPVTNSGPYVSLPNLPELISVISASQSLIWVTHSQRASSTSHTHTREHTHTRQLPHSWDNGSLLICHQGC